MASHEKPELELGELMTLITMFGSVALAIALSAITSVRNATVDWLLTYDLLVTDNVTLAIPGTDGAGFDTIRLIVAAATILILFVGFIKVCRWRGRRELLKSADS